MGLIRVKRYTVLYSFLLATLLVQASECRHEGGNTKQYVGPKHDVKNKESDIFFEKGKVHGAILKDSNDLLAPKDGVQSTDTIQTKNDNSVIKQCKEYLALIVSMPEVYDNCEGTFICSCKNHKVYGKIVDCSDKNIEDIPVFPNDTNILLLNGNLIKNLIDGVFHYLKKLKYLDISHNRILELSNSSFNGLGSLCILKINGNHLRYTNESIPEGSFVPLTNLVYLDLQQNLTNISIEEIYPSTAISTLTNLQFLLIDGLGDKPFQDDFKKLQEFSNLSMIGGRCQMNTIEKDTFSNIPFLKSLSVVNCNVTKVENGSFAELPSLTSLDLSYNMELTFASLSNITFALKDKTMYSLNVTKIHKTFGGCTHLEATNLKHMKNMTIENLIMDSNRLAVMENDAVHNIPIITGMLSVKDNVLMLGQYIFPLLNSKNLSTLVSINLANQMFNHNISDLLLSYQQAMSSNIHHFSRRETSNKILNPTENAYRQIMKRWFPTSCENCIQSPHAIHYNIPKNIQNIDMSNMKARYPLQGVCVCEPNSLKKLDLHRNIFYRIEGHVEGLSKLEWLDFSSNFCENISANVLHKLKGLQHLNLSNNYLGSSFHKDNDGNIFRSQHRLKTLDLSDNRIRILRPKFFSGLTDIEHLILRRNLMTEFDVDLKSLENLYYLDLSYNILLRLSDSIIDEFQRLAANNLTMDLSSNNFSCGCKHLNVLKWVSDSKIKFIHLQEYTCTDEAGHFRNMSDASELYTELSKYCKSYTLLIIICSSVLVLFLTVLAICILYRYRWNLRYIYYSGKMRMKGYLPLKDDDNDFDHDVFVSFANENNLFIRDFVIPELEEKRRLRLLLHDRDFRPGELINDNIVKAICTSRKTLIVMSEAFLQSMWCRFEMHMARMEAIKTERNVLTLVLLEDVPTTGLPLEIVDIIRQQTYLEFPRDDIHREQFWDRLFEALK